MNDVNERKDTAGTRDGERKWWLDDPSNVNKIVYGLTKAGRDALAKWVYGESRSQAAKDELLIKLYNRSEENVSHLAAEIAERRQEMMRLLYLYEKIRLRHYADPHTLPTRSKGVYLALASGIGQGRQFLSWCDEALELMAGLENAGRVAAPRRSAI